MRRELVCECSVVLWARTEVHCVGGVETESLSPRVQQAPKPGESLELPLGPPVKQEVLCGSAVECSVGEVKVQCSALWRG